MAIISPPAGLLQFKGPQSPTATDRWMQSGTVLLTGLALTVALSTAMPAGAVTLAGQAPTAARGPSSVIDLPATALVYTGLAPTLPAGQVGIALPAGSLLWTGLPGDPVIITITIVPPAGTLVFKGPARPQEVPMPGQGLLVLAGQIPNPTVSTGGSSPTIGMPVGLLTWHSVAATVSNDRSILLSAGSWVLSGQYVGIAFSPLNAGSLVWQGFIPTVIATTTGSIAVGAGSLVWHSDAVTSHLDRGPQMPAGSLLFTGRIPLSGQTSTVLPDAGSLVLAGQVPIALKDVSPQPLTGHLAIVGQEVTVFLETTYPLPAGVLTWTGYIAQPTITAFDNQAAQPGAGVLTFASLAPTVTATTTTAFQPGAGTLTLSGQAPTLLRDVFFAMPAGALLFNGQIATPPNLPTMGVGRLVFSGQRIRSVNSGDASPIPPLSYGAGMFFYQSQRRQNP